MVKICECGSRIPRSKVIDGKERNLNNRTKCLVCLPFGQSRYRKREGSELRSFRAEQTRLWYKRQRDAGREPVGERRTRNRRLILGLIGVKCQFCDYDKTIRNLAFHHIYNKEYDLSLATFGWGLGTILPELYKTVVACHNCHGEIHDGLISIEIVLQKHEYFVDKLKVLEGLKWDDFAAVAQR